jgi:hypothetical protein
MNKPMYDGLENEGVAWSDGALVSHADGEDLGISGDESSTANMWGFLLRVELGVGEWQWRHARDMTKKNRGSVCLMSFANGLSGVDKPFVAVFFSEKKGPQKS